MSIQAKSYISAEKWEETLYFVARAVNEDQYDWADLMRYVQKQMEVAKLGDPHEEARRILACQTDAGGRKAAR